MPRRQSIALRALVVAAMALFGVPTTIAQATSPRPPPCPRAGPAFERDVTLTLPAWSHPYFVAFAGTALARRERTATEVAADGPDSWKGLSIWAVRVEHALKGHVGDRVEVYGLSRAEGNGWTPGALAVGTRYQFIARAWPAGVGIHADSGARLVLSCAVPWTPEPHPRAAGRAAPAGWIAVAPLILAAAVGLGLATAGRPLRVWRSGTERG